MGHNIRTWCYYFLYKNSHCLNDCDYLLGNGNISTTSVTEHSNRLKYHRTSVSVNTTYILILNENVFCINQIYFIYLGHRQ